MAVERVEGEATYVASTGGETLPGRYHSASAATMAFKFFAKEGAEFLAELYERLQKPITLTDLRVAYEALCDDRGARQVYILFGPYMQGQPSEQQNLRAAFWDAEMKPVGKVPWINKYKKIVETAQYGI
jgi:hypothetical protein